MRVLFVEPFYGGSHRAFADGLVRHSQYEIELLTLPEGEWRRRMRRGSQELAAMVSDMPGQFDAIVVTDMLDLPTFLALTRPRFERTPVLLYLHENQFTYPRIRGAKLDSWFGGINYLSARAADAVAFNSDYHRADFLAALRRLTTHPNNWLVPEAVAEIEAKSGVLPVGVDFEWLDAALPEVAAAGRERDVPRVLWNSRWEFDKAPDLFARTMRNLALEGVAFELAICGDPGPNPHPALLQLRHELPERIVQFGLAESRTRYAEILWESDIVVSTSRHEFFGIGMVEAMYAGCLPVAPRALNYPDLIPPQLHESCLYRSEEESRALLRARLTGPIADHERTSLHEAASRYAWPFVAPTWDAALASLVDCSFETSGIRGIG